jgi:hypothetical protein
MLRLEQGLLASRKSIAKTDCEDMKRILDVFRTILTVSDVETSDEHDRT